MRQRLALTAQTLIAKLNQQAAVSGGNTMQPAPTVPPGPAGNNGANRIVQPGPAGNSSSSTSGSPMQMTVPNPGWGQLPPIQ